MASTQTDCYADRMGIYGNELQAAVAKELQAERAAVNMTMQQLADASGIGVQTVHRYLTGKRDIPVTAMLEMCRSMNVDPHEMMLRAERRLEKG